MSWGNLTEERVALYLTEVLEALHYLHSWRIAHLDLKVNKYFWSSDACVDRPAHWQGSGAILLLLLSKVHSFVT